VDPELDQTVQRALAKEPDARFPDAESFAQALRQGPSNAGQTVAQPLTGKPVATSVQPLADAENQDDGDHEQLELPPSGRSHRQERIEIRRSARKVYVAALLLGALVVGASYLFSHPPGGLTVPRYPPAAYGVVPAVLAVLLTFAWVNTRAWMYSMDSHAAVVQWGVFGHHRFGVPLRLITTVELKQSPIDRLLGVGTVELTARDQHGEERRVVLEDLPRPRRTYEALMQHVGTAMRYRGTLPAE
jgi:membrane protein YdbS with pleckstrin-like domain